MSYHLPLSSLPIRFHMRRNTLISPTGDLIVLEVMNTELLQGAESWRFGPVLPMVLIASTIFMAFDAYDRIRKL